MNDRTIVTLAMVFVGAVALASTPEWALAAKDFVRRKETGAPSPRSRSSGAGGSSSPLAPSSNFGRWALGYALLFVVLVGLADAGFGKFSVALAVLVAGGATALYLPEVFANLGLAQEVK